MSLKPQNPPIQQFIKPQDPIKQIFGDGDDGKIISAPDKEKAIHLVKLNVLLRPWLFKKEMAQLVNLPVTQVNEIFKELGIKKTIATWERKMKKRMKTDVINDVKNALREVDPKYRLYVLSKRDFLPLYMTGLTTDVRLTEAFGKLHMETELKKILLRNFESALKNDYKAWKRLVKYIMGKLEEGVDEKEIIEAYEGSQFDIDEKFIEEVKKIQKKIGSYKNFSTGLTADELRYIKELAKEMVETLPEEIKNLKLCPAYASNSKEHRGKQRMISEFNPDGSQKIFSRPVYNIPYLNYSPPKRVQIAAHSIAKDRSSIEMKYGERALVRARYNDLDYKGVNAKMEVVMDTKDPLFKKTYGGGIVITEGLAKKLTHIWKSPANTAVSLTKDGFLPEGTFVRRGDAVVKDPIMSIDFGLERTFSPYEGRIVWLGPPKKRTRKYGLTFWKRKYIIVREEPAKIGDKIMSRTGLRGVITDIIPGEEPKIFVNYTDVWKDFPEDLREKGEKILEKERRGEKLTEDEKQILREYRKVLNKRKAALLKEAKDGAVFIYFEPDGLISNYRGSGLKLSWTLLMGALEKVPFERLWQLYYFPKKDLKLIMKTLHLKIVKTDDGKFKIVLDPEEPKPDKDGMVIPFEHAVGGKTYKYIYVPYKFQRLTVDKDGTIRRFGLYEDMNEREKRFAWNKNFKTSLARMLWYHLFSPRFGAGLERKLVAADVAPDEVIISKRDAEILGVKDGDLIGFRKEPVTTSASLLTLRVKVDKSGKYTNVVGINPYVAEKGNFDFDGDSCSIFIPHPGEEFIPKYKKEELEPEPVGKLPDDEEIESMFMDDETLARETRIYNRDTRAQDNEDIKYFGAARKRAFSLYPHLPTSVEEINRVFDVEQVMKAKKRDLKRREELRKLVERESRKRGKLIRLFMLIDEKRKFPDIIPLLIDTELDPNYLLDRIILWSYFGKAYTDIHIRKLPLSELKKELQRVRRLRKDLEKRLMESDAFSDLERYHFLQTVRDYLNYEKDLEREIRKMEKKKIKQK